MSKHNKKQKETRTRARNLRKAFYYLGKQGRKHVLAYYPESWRFFFSVLFTPFPPNSKKERERERELRQFILLDLPIHYESYAWFSFGSIWKKENRKKEELTTRLQFEEDKFVPPNKLSRFCRYCTNGIILFSLQVWKGCLCKEVNWHLEWFIV